LQGGRDAHCSRLELCVLREQVERPDREYKFAAVRELADADAERNQVLASHLRRRG